MDGHPGLRKGVVSITNGRTQVTTSTDKHENDIYGDLDKKNADEPAIPAATVVLLRDDTDGVEVLMLRKNARIDFGGMWVFPGGRIDPNDYQGGDDLEAAARRAASREAEEEAGISPVSSEFVWFAHWTPPASTARRYATWFFATHADIDEPIKVDGGEIEEHAWINPAAALEKHSAGEIDLAPPTWVTLYELSRYQPTAAVLTHLASREPKVYETHVAERSDGIRVAMWHGDSGYVNWDPDLDGDRHRLVMARGGFTFENTVEDY